MNSELRGETGEGKLADRRVMELEGMIPFIHKRKKQIMNARVEREREREREVCVSRQILQSFSPNFRIGGMIRCRLKREV
jgi:hypothetical protein